MHFLTTRFSPLPSAGLRCLFKVSTRREALPELIVVQIQNLEAKWFPEDE